MTRLDVSDEERSAPAECDGPQTLLLEAREVPLGGVRAMSVRRVLPQRALPLVGAWCFLDRFGPQDARMRVEPHPHIGLQTVTWPFVGDVHHRDTLGSDVVIGRGSLNIMTSGAGIAHSEYSLGEDEVPLDALQLWIALPESRRHGAPAFERHENLPELPLGDGAVATVVVGTLGDTSSPATTYTPIVGAEIVVPAGAQVDIPLVTTWEYAVLTCEGTVHVTDPSGDTATPEGDLLYLGIGRQHVTLRAESNSRIFLLGGEPFEADIVMWWNFVARSHEEVVEAREAWEADTERFGHVVGHGDERIPAPPLPTVRLTTRRRP